MDTKYIIIALIAVFAGYVIISMLTGKRKPEEDETEAESEEEAYELNVRVAEKKTVVDYGGIVYASDDRLKYLVNFVREDGSEAAYEVPLEDYEALNEGDCVTIAIEGERYLGFSKEGSEEVEE